MKNITLALGLLFSLQSFAADSTLVCNDQNGHSIYRLQLSEDLNTSKLTTLIGDSTTLSAGTKNLRLQEGESTLEAATFAGKTNSGLSIALIFNADKASSLKSNEILEITAYYQVQKSGNLSGHTTLLCSKN